MNYMEAVESQALYPFGKKLRNLVSR